MTTDRLVMGCISGLEARYFIPFLQSLRASGYEGRVVLLASNIKLSEMDILRRWAEVRDVTDSVSQIAGRGTVAALRRLKQQRGLRRFYARAFRAATQRDERRWADLELRLQGLQALRYRFYLEFLRDHAPDADRVLICDVRDVLFQSDPLEGPVPELQVVLEPESEVLGGPGFNTRWVRRLYGQVGVDQVSGKVASCCGTVLGRREGMMRYLRTMDEAIRGHYWPLGPHDQGIHNMLLYTGCLDPVKIQANQAGQIITMGLQPEVRRNARGYIVNRDDSIPAVVHQYDRHAGLGDSLLPLLAPSPRPDEEMVDA